MLEHEAFSHQFLLLSNFASQFLLWPFLVDPYFVMLFILSGPPVAYNLSCFAIRTTSSSLFFPNDTIRCVICPHSPSGQLLPLVLLCLTTIKSFVLDGILSVKEY
ncbi:unnamed protein product [Caenorhabditis nigoni]